MVQIILIGIGAGLASALLFASVASGLLISIALVYLAPLPIMIAGLGWSHWAGLLATLVASTSISLTFKESSDVFPTFLLGIGLPSWWLCYLALLARPVATPTGNTLEWYPVGRLVIWSVILSGLVIVAVLLVMGTSEDTVRGALRKGFEKFFLLPEMQVDVSRANDLGSRIDALVTIAPAAAAVFLTLLNLMIFWLAGRVVNVSGRLRRPWPDLSAMTFPAMTPNLLAVTMVCVLLAGLIGIISSVFAASFVTAYAVLGLVVLHAVTRGMNGRGLLLTGVYVTIVFIWPVLLLFAMLGLADAAFDIRNRIGKNRGPPTLRA
jgi:hypothetical protein